MKRLFILACMSIFALVTTVANAETETTFTQANNGLPELAIDANGDRYDQKELKFQTPEGQEVEFGIGGEITLKATRAYLNPTTEFGGTSDRHGLSLTNPIVARPVPASYCKTDGFSDLYDHFLDEGVLLYTTAQFWNYALAEPEMQNHLWQNLSIVGNNYRQVMDDSEEDGVDLQDFSVIQFHSHKPLNISYEVLGTYRDEIGTVYAMPTKSAKILGCYEVTGSTSRHYQYYWLSRFDTYISHELMFKSDNTYYRDPFFNIRETTEDVRTLFWTGRTLEPSHWTNYWE